MQGHIQRCAAQSLRGLWLSSSSVVYLVGHRALPLVSLMMLERGECCLRDVSGLTVWQHLGHRRAPWAVLEAGRNPRNPWSFLFLYFFLSALHSFSCHVLFNWLANLPCRWSSLKWLCIRLRKGYLFTSFQRNRVCPGINCHLATA